MDKTLVSNGPLLFILSAPMFQSRTHKYVRVRCSKLEPRAQRWPSPNSCQIHNVRSNSYITKNKLATPAYRSILNVGNPKYIYNSDATNYLDTIVEPERDQFSPSNAREMGPPLISLQPVRSSPVHLPLACLVRLNAALVPSRFAKPTKKSYQIYRHAHHIQSARCFNRNTRNLVKNIPNRHTYPRRMERGR